MAWLNSRKFKKIFRGISDNFLSLSKNKAEEIDLSGGSYLLPVESQTKNDCHPDVAGRIPGTRKVKPLISQRSFASLKMTNKNIFSKVFGVHRFFIHKLRNFKLKSLRPILASILILVMLVQIFQPGLRDMVYGATYTFNQTNWSGGVSGSIGVHPTDDSGLASFASVSSTMNIINVGADLRLTTTTVFVTSTDDGTSNTGYNLNGKTFSQTNVVNSGANASIALAPASTAGGSGADGVVTINTSKNINSDVLGSNGRMGFKSAAVDSTNLTGLITSLAIGSDGFARIAYKDNTTGYLRFARCTNADCSSKNINTVDATAMGLERSISIQMAPDGFARIGYATNAGYLKFAQCTNADCTSKTLTTVDTGSSGYNANMQTSMVLGADGFGRIISSQSAGYAAFFQCTNAACSTYNAVAIETLVAPGQPSITLGLDGFAVMAYSASGLKYVRCSNASCSTNVQSPNITGNSSDGQYSSLVIASDGFARISHFNSTNSDLKYVQCLNSDCTSIAGTSIETVGSVGKHTSLAIGSDNFARISYYYETSLDLKYVQCTSASCATKNITIIDSVGSVGQYTSLGLMPGDLPIISYFDSTRGDLKVASYGAVADGVSYNVTVLTASTATLSADPAGSLVPGDKVLLINLQGTTANQGNVGNYEIMTVASVSGITVTFTGNKTKYYGTATSTNDTNLGVTPNTQRVVLQRIPQYTNVTIQNGGTLTANAWDGVKGGVLAFMATGTVDVQSGGAINMTGKGFRGGSLPTVFGNAGFSGESYNATGTPSVYSNYGGGNGTGYDAFCYYMGQQGFSGAYATQAYGSYMFAPIVYGTSSLASMFFGSGGGGGSDSNAGNGGGITYIEASNFSLVGGLENKGGAGGPGMSASGAGAGGSIFLKGNTINFGSGLLNASGGAGGVSTWDGDQDCIASPTTPTGGDGRIYIQSNNISGTSAPASITGALSTTYYASGTYTSGIIDMGAGVGSWENLSWINSGGQTITIKVRTSNDSAMSGATAFSSCTNITNGALLTTGNCVTSGHRYVQYEASLSTADTAVTPSLDSVSIGYVLYSSSASLVSVPFDSGDSSNVMGSINWDEDTSLPVGTSVILSLRTANNSSMTGATAWQNFTNVTANCTKSVSSVSCPNSAIPTIIKDSSDDRYFQYKITLTSTGGYTATVSEVRTQFVVNAPPEVQNITAVQNADGTVSIAYEMRSADTLTDTGSVGFLTPSFQYCVNGGGSCSTISALTAGATSSQAVNLDGTTWSSFSLTWSPSVDTNNVWDANAKIKVFANDLQAANNTYSTSSPAFVLDTKAPTGASVRVDATSTPQTIYLSVSDTSTPVVMKYATSLGALSSASYAAFSPTVSLSLSDPSTVYAQFRDAKNNESSIVSVTNPYTPRSVMVQDNSNFKVTPHDYRLFLAWKVVTTSPQGSFSGYKIYRATSGSGPWSLQYTESNINNNYYTDNNTLADTLYYYKVVSTDTLGNFSFNSTIINAMANGVQDYGEGGGGTAGAPVISNVVVSNISGTSAMITWDTDTLSNSTIGYSTTPGVFSGGIVSVASMVNSASGIGQHSIILSNLNPGTPYYFQVTSANNQGNVANDDNGGSGYTFTTTNGPSISNVSAPTVGNTSAIITWSTDIAASSKVYYSTSTSFATAFNVEDLSATTNHSINILTLNTSTKYYYFVESTGGGGTSEDRNVVSGVPQYYNFNTTNDVSFPTFSTFQATPATSSVIITWQTNKDSDSQVDYGTTVSYGSQSVLDLTPLTKVHTMTITGLNPATTYHYRARSRDTNGNLGLSSDHTFTTLADLDLTAPTITNIASSTTLTSATITWQTSAATNGTVAYSLDSNLTPVISSVNDTNSSDTTHSVTLTNLQGNTTYYFRITSVGTLNNVSNSSPILTFVTTPDVTAPVINNLRTVAKQNLAYINWDTNELSTSQVDYSIDAFYASSTASTTPTVSHYLILTGLTPNQTYNFRVSSTDSSGNNSTVTGQTFTTDAAPDTNPPTFSSGPTVSSVALHSATVNWTMNKLTNGTVEFGTNQNSLSSIMGNLYDFTSSSHSVTLSGLLGNTTYYFRANSMDASANSASSTGSFTTQNDTVPPVIFSTTSIANNTAAFINWQTDELAFSEVNYGLDPFQLLTQVAITSTPNTNHSLSLTGLTPSTTYFYNIRAADPSANTSTVGPYSFETPNTGVQTIIIDNTKPNIVIDNTRYPDTTLPTISNLQVTELTPFSATINWTTDKDGNSLVEYGNTINYGSLAGIPILRMTNHKVPISNLTPGTTYHFKAETFDALGNLGSSADNFFTTLNVDGTEAKTNEISTTPEEEKQLAARQFVIDQIAKAPISLLASMLEAFSKNPFLNQLSDESAGRTFSEIASQIGQAPIIVGLRPQVEVHGNSATIRWSTDKKTTGLVSFAKESDYAAGTDKPYTTSIVDGDSLSTVHSVELSSLDSATRYHFQVASKGEIGPEARSKDYTFETEAILPTVSDTKVTDVKATSAIVSWKSNVPTASTLEYTNLDSKKTLTSGDPALLITHVFTLQNLEPGIKYSLVIKAKNESGQEQPSEPIFFETIIDKDVPLIMNVTANSTLYPGATSKVQTIVSWDTDEPTVSQLFYQEGVQDNDEKVKTTTIELSPSLKHFVVLTAFKPGSVYKYWVEATDLSGNKTQSDKFTTLTPVEKQTIIDIISNNFQSVFGWTKNVGL